MTIIEDSPNVNCIESDHSYIKYLLVYRCLGGRPDIEGIMLVIFLTYLLVYRWQHSYQRDYAGHISVHVHLT